MPRKVPYLYSTIRGEGRVTIFDLNIPSLCHWHTSLDLMRYSAPYNRRYPALYRRYYAPYEELLCSVIFRNLRYSALFRLLNRRFLRDQGTDAHFVSMGRIVMLYSSLCLHDSAINTQ